MTLTLDLTREEEDRLSAAAREQGAAPAEVLRTLMRQHLPPVGAMPPPNEEALATLRDIAKLKEGMPETDGSQTDQMLRTGRAGAMFPQPEPEKGDAFYQTATPEEWSRAWRAWAAGHKPQPLGLSNEAVSRDSIYEGCG